MMKYTTLLLILLASSTTYLFSQPFGYNFAKQIFIQSSQVAGVTNHTDFPMLLKFVDPDLRSTANGGNVENVNGYDILFTLDDCTTQLDHEVEKYDPTTGEYIAWIKIPSLSPTVNTEIQMYYGNASVAADQSTNATWSAGFDGVWHLENNFIDASGSGNNGVNNGSTNFSPSQISDGQNFNDPNHWIELASHPQRVGGFSYSGWFRSNNVNEAGQRIICDDATNGAGCHAISLGDSGSGRVRFYIRGLNPVSLDSPNLISNGVWHHVAVTYNGGTQVKSMFIDGALVASASVTGALGPANGNASIGGEVAAGESNNRFDGALDEIRSFNDVLSADWIATEYNNQNNPSSFYTVSGEVNASTLCVVLPIELNYFEAMVENNRTIQLNWQTESEINNDYFTVERSQHGEDWEPVSKIEGAGNSSSSIDYSDEDKSPYTGVSYYRLKQTDFDGQVSYSDVKSVNLTSDDSTELLVYPNPTKNHVVLTSTKDDLKEISIINASGQNVVDQTFITKNSDTEYVIDLSLLSSGIYLIKTTQNAVSVQKQ